MSRLTGEMGTDFLPFLAADRALGQRGQDELLGRVNGSFLTAGLRLVLMLKYRQGTRGLALEEGPKPHAALEELHRRAEDDAEAYVACTAVAEDPAAPFWSGARLQELAHVRRVREWKPWRTEEIRAGRLPDAYRTPPDPIALLDRLKTLPKASLESVILRVRVDHSILSESPQMQRSIDLLRWAEQDPARVTRLAELVANEGVSPR